MYGKVNINNKTYMQTKFIALLGKSITYLYQLAFAIKYTTKNVMN